MKPLTNKFLTIIVVLLFTFSVGTAIHATDTMREDTSNNEVDNETKRVFFDEENTNNYRLLNGKYPVMADRLPNPKTMIPDEEPQPTGSFDNLPSQFSWKNYGGDWMTPVKDQGNCGSCWDFSAIGTMEAAINLASGYPDTDLDLSEQYVLSCLPYGGSCGGGWTDDAFEAIISTDPSIGNGINGVPLESCMPYEASDSVPCSDKCDDWDTYSEPPQETDILWQLEEWGANHGFENDNPTDRDVVKSWIMDKGPISSSMYATSAFSSYWESHHSSDDWFYEEDHGYTNHAVVLLGWKDDPDVTNGGYWILKNSWGPGWGYGGYFNAAYGGQDIAEIVRWCKAVDWPESTQGAGPIDVDMAVFADFSFETDLGDHYPHVGDEIQFTDTSDGDIALREWDFDGDGSIDSTQKNPVWSYNMEGDYEVTLTVKGEFGLESNRTYTVSVKEVWPPEAVLPSEIVDNELTYSFNGKNSKDRDGGTIVSYSWDFDDGSTAEGSMVTHTFSEPDNVYEVTLTVTDNDGASESAVCSVKIDQSVPPVTQIVHRGVFEKQDWYGSTQNVFFDAVDWSEVIETFYRVDDGDWQRISGGESVAIGTEGSHTVEAYSVDYYGNEESPVSETFGIDRSVPSVDVSVVGEKVGEWYTNPVEVTLDGSDSLSGLDQITYKVDNSGWQQYSGSFSVGEGVHQIWAVAVDNAGNTVDEQVTVKVDTGAPTADCTFVGEGSNNVFYQSVKVQVYGIDPGSGVDEVYYKIDGGSFKVYTGPVTVDTIGDHTVEFYAVDNLGNEGARETRSFTVSPVNFEMNLDQPENALYIFGVELIGLGNPVIIGPIDIMVSVEAFTTAPANIDYVEFFVDGESMMVDTEAPYIWSLDQQLFGSHTIKVDAVAGDEIVSESVQATCIIP